MDWPQTVSGAALVVALLGLSVGFGRRQFRDLRRLREQGEHLPPEDLRYERAKAWRRLAGCVLTLLLAVGLAAALLFLENPAQRLADAHPVLQPDGTREFSPEERTFIRAYAGTWITLLLLLLALLGIAGVDLLATRRYARRHHRKIQEDRRAMIQRQVNRMRQERNGRG